MPSLVLEQPMLVACVKLLTDIQISSEHMISKLSMDIHTDR